MGGGGGGGFTGRAFHMLASVDMVKTMASACVQYCVHGRGFTGRAFHMLASFRISSNFLNSEQFLGYYKF